MGSKPKKVSTEDKILAELLKGKLNKLGRSRLSLVQQTGIGKSRLYDLLDGKKPFYMDDVKRICDALGEVYWKTLKEVEESLLEEQNQSPALITLPTRHPRTLADLGLTEADLLNAAAHDTGEPAEAEHEQPY